MYIPYYIFNYYVIALTEESELTETLLISSYEVLKIGIVFVEEFLS